MKRQSLIIVLIITLGLLSYEGRSQMIKSFVTAGANLSQFDGDEAFGYHKIGVNVGIGAEINFNKFLSASLETNFNQKGAYRKPRSKISPTGKYSLKMNYVEIPIIFHFTDNTNNFKFGVGASYGYAVSIKEFEDRMVPGHRYVIYNPPDPEERNASNIIMYKDFVPNNEAKKGFEYLDVVNAWNEKNNRINPHDFSIIGDVSVRLWQQLFLNVRYTYSLRSLRRSDYYITDNVDLDMLDQRKIDFYSDDFFIVKQRKSYNNVISVRLTYIINEKQSDRTRGLIRGKDSEVKKKRY